MLSTITQKCFFFLILRIIHKVKTISSIKIDNLLLIQSIHYKKAAARFVRRMSKPVLDIVLNLSTHVKSPKTPVHPHLTNQDSRITPHRFGFGILRCKRFRNRLGSIPAFTLSFDTVNIHTIQQSASSVTKAYVLVRSSCSYR